MVASSPSPGKMPPALTGEPTELFAILCREAGEAGRGYCEGDAAPLPADDPTGKLPAPSVLVMGDLTDGLSVL